MPHACLQRRKATFHGRVELANEVACAAYCLSEAEGVDKKSVLRVAQGASSHRIVDSCMDEAKVDVLGTCVAKTSR